MTKPTKASEKLVQAFTSNASSTRSFRATINKGGLPIYDAIIWFMLSMMGPAVFRLVVLTHAERPVAIPILIETGTTGYLPAWKR
jgi:hypothetical protein